MASKLRHFVRRYLPPTARRFDRAVKGIEKRISEQDRRCVAILAEIERDQEIRQQGVTDLRGCNAALLAEMESVRQENAALLSEMKSLREQNRAMLEGITDIRAQCDQSRIMLERIAADAPKADERTSQVLQAVAILREERAAASVVALETLQATKGTLVSLECGVGAGERLMREVLWAEVFGSTIASSTWFRGESLSPGRWAVGYPYLYVLYRILDEIRPARILELGLGQSTRMISRYAASNDVEHHVVEHDERWLDWFLRASDLPANTQVVRLDWAYVTYNEVADVRIYDGFADTFSGKRFDFISIDAPLGGDMEHYARVDVLGLLPGCLAESFVIMIDDLERPGESRTFAEMKEALARASVEYACGVYSGVKDVGVLCSPDLAFLCSL